MFYIYHIPGKKIGVTRNLNKRVTVAQGYQPNEYEVLESNKDIDYISKREAELQLLYGYKVDRDSYKKVINRRKKQNQMKLNVTDQTTTFPYPVNKLKGHLLDNTGMTFETPFGVYVIDNSTIPWILSNVNVSMFNNNRCFIYNKALHQAFSNKKTDSTANGNESFKRQINEALSSFMQVSTLAEEKQKEPEASNIYDLIRGWAKEKGIYNSGDSKTQYIKLMEEAGELAQAILKQDKAEIKDAIGDMIVVLTNLAHLEDMYVEDCIGSAYEVIKNRSGQMVNGTFVKNNQKKVVLQPFPGANITMTL
jgi:NTP pyrophosphatase (non-canonical NTP hydrolase)